VPGDVLGEAALARARAGDEDAFRELTDPYRRELQVHCYRILGSVQDAEDLVQETRLAAWRGLDAFEGRSSIRAWLYRIATNRCLNALRDRARQGPRHHRLDGEPAAPPLTDGRRLIARWTRPRFSHARLPAVMVRCCLDECRAGEATSRGTVTPAAPPDCSAP